MLCILFLIIHQNFLWPNSVLNMKDAPTPLISIPTSSFWLIENFDTMNTKSLDNNLFALESSSDFIVETESSTELVSVPKIED